MVGKLSRFAALLIVALSIYCGYLMDHQSPNNVELHEPLGWTIHNQTVDAISKSITDYLRDTTDTDQPCISIAKKMHASITRSDEYKQQCHQVNVSGLSHIIALDLEADTAWIASNMNMEQIYNQLIAYGYIMAVIPEFKHITIGGSVSGYGVESTSFKYGLLHDACLAYQVFRHDLGAFWVIEGDPAIWFLNRFLFMRYLFGYMLSAKHLYQFKSKNWNEIEAEFTHAVHDYVIPADNIDAFLSQSVNRYFGRDSILWLCPVHNARENAMDINVGLYRKLTHQHCSSWTECVEIYRELEMQAISYGGKVWYYSSSFLNRTEFEMLHMINKQFDYDKYMQVRREYHIRTIDLYNKIGTIGSRNHSHITLQRPLYEHVTTFPIALKYAAWWIQQTFAGAL